VCEKQKFTVSLFINRSQQDVFDFLTNPTNLSKWDSDFGIVQWDRPDKYRYWVKERMFLFERAETAITLNPKDNGIDQVRNALPSIWKRFSLTSDRILAGMV